MTDGRSTLRRHAARVVALLLVATLWGFARLPRLSPAERSEMASRFAFSRSELITPPGLPSRTLRAVHPSLARFAAWISGVGAAVALADLDGNGLADDVCHVDTRSDAVIVAPVPGSGDRYAAFTLEAAAGPHDPATIAPMGCVPGDLDEDGREDLVVYYWGRPPVAFVRRAADPEPPGREGYRALDLAPAGERWNTNALTRADIDGDGHADLVVGNYFPDGAAVLDPHGEGTLSMQHSMSRAANGGHNRLLLWRSARPGAEPEVVYDEAVGAFDPQTETSWTLAVGAADLDGDQRPEIYFGNDFGPDRLLHNRSRPGRVKLVPLEGRRGFTTPRSKVLGHDSFKGMGIDFADLNGDGRLDLYVSNIAEEFALEESHFVYVSTGEVESMAEGVAPYVDRSEPLGLARSAWSWDARFADFDNDGVPEAVQATGFVAGSRDRWPELHEVAMGNDELLRFPWAWPHLGPGDDLSGDAHNPFFVRAASGRYFDLAADLGLGQAQVSRGIAVADVDGDGDLDFAVANQWAPSVFYRNESPHPGAALELDLRLPVAGGALTPAIGAEARVEVAAGRRLMAQVDGGSGHSGVRAPELHFGLGAGASGTPLPVEVSWRDREGAVHTLRRRLPPGRHVVVLGAGTG